MSYLPLRTAFPVQQPMSCRPTAIRKILMPMPAETKPNSPDAADHPFVRSPHTTLLRLSLPVLVSLVAEPVTGMVDTAFVAKLGAPELAALGVGTMLLSGIFWAFNFLGIGAQTECAQAMGARDGERVRQTAGLALALAVGFGLLLILALIPLNGTLTHLMGAEGAVHRMGEDYIRIRLFGAPAILISFAAFGIMRGREDMTTPLWVAGGINVLNMALDPLLIFGWSFFPAMGVSGAALASVISQWTGTLFCLSYLYRSPGISFELPLSRALGLMRVGRDLFIRTGLLTLFLMLITRGATALGPDAGAAHQVLRQAWIFTAFFMDAYAVAGQSLVGYFMGGGQVAEARRVAKVVCTWGLVTGTLLGAGMLAGISWVMAVFVPPTAAAVFTLPWTLVALTLPVNSLAFATDGIHWGTGDFRYLRNVVILATLSAGSALFLLEYLGWMSLNTIWLAAISWVSVRCLGGIGRIWPGWGNSPLSAAGK